MPNSIPATADTADAGRSAGTGVTADAAVTVEGLPETAGRTGFVGVDSSEELRELLGEPHPIVVDKVHQRLADADLDMLARSPFCLLATSDADGNCDASPRGGEPGFAHVLDPGTLVLPDFPGNRRGDSFHNVLENPHVGLVFLIPHSTHVLRINGRAGVLRDAPFFDAMTHKGRRPQLALLVETDEIYLHCPQSLNRARLWDADNR
jgi:PPOX class probable FMN-dependent enzyme